MRAFFIILAISGAALAAPGGFDYQVLATNRTATLQTEMNADAVKGYQYAQFVGGATSFGWQELVVAMVKPDGSATAVEDLSRA
jgi:hypothetical protein